MYRAYWAIPRTLSTKAGEQVNAVFGFASMILTILRKEEPTHFLICFDEGEQTFRHQENATYKDGRAETPDDFYSQIPRIQEFVSVSGIQHNSHPGFEADDLLCTYARAAEKAGMRTTIVTGDRDAFQLATEKITIAIPHGGYQTTEYLGPKEILAKYGVRPDQIADYKGLTGDSSDNLPGVKGIGPKTAAQLLQEYDTLDALYEHLDAVKPAVRAKLEADRESAFFCRRMAVLIDTIPLVPPLEDIRLSTLPCNDILAFFRTLEFTMLTRRLLDLRATPYGTLLCPGPVNADAQTAPKETEQLTLFS